MKKTASLLCVLFPVLVSGCHARSRIRYRDDTRKVLEAKLPEIKACYDKVLKGDQKAKGYVTMRFKVMEETGQFTDLSVEASRTQAPEALVACVNASFDDEMKLAPPDKRQGHATFVWEFGVEPGDFGKAPMPKGDDDGPRGGAVATEYATIRPAAHFKLTEDKKVHMTVLGVVDPATSHAIDLKPGETLVVLEDGKEVPMTVVPKDDNTEQVTVDLVFAVDNSGSMGQEADGIAEKIVAFAQLLAKSGVDARFAVVGVNGDVTGAFDFGTADAMDKYLKMGSGTRRTKHFGSNAKLEKAAKGLRSSYPSEENGIAAIKFANDHLTWRKDAQRIFISFTDEPTHPSTRNAPWSTTKATCDAWTPTSGNVHTVWSGSSLGRMRWREGRAENPAELSRCTGGVVMSVRRDAKDLDLTTLPMTEALTQSVIVEYESADPAAKHDVVVVVKGTNSEGRTEYKQIGY